MTTARTVTPPTPTNALDRSAERPPTLLLWAQRVLVSLMITVSSIVLLTCPHLDPQTGKASGAVVAGCFFLGTGVILALTPIAPGAPWVEHHPTVGPVVVAHTIAGRRRVAVSAVTYVAGWQPKRDPWGRDEMVLLLAGRRALVLSGPFAGSRTEDLIRAIAARPGVRVLPGARTLLGRVDAPRGIRRVGSWLVGATWSALLVVVIVLVGLVVAVPFLLAGNALAG